MESGLATARETTAAARAAAWGGKYLTFLLDGEDYALAVEKVREIVGHQDITQVPQTAAFVRGVINLRGKVIPVVDLRAKFRLPEAPYDAQTCVIVVDVGTLMGVIVDTVHEVYDIRAEDIEPPPQLGSDADNAFILGMGKVKGEVKMLLDIDQVLNGEDLVERPHEALD